MEFSLEKIEDWEAVVDEIKPQLVHSILLLKGNLGVGKTSFTQYLLRALGSTDTISSPTYTIVNEYHTPMGAVFHFDLYRMNTLEEIWDIGIEEYLDTGYLSIIEWPELYETELEGILYHQMTIENIDGKRRVIFS